jgi:hypothetical protein
MSTQIKLVQGDNRPNVKLTLTNADGSVLDVSAATAIVVYFRKAGAAATLATLACTKTNGGADGVIQFKFPGTTLNVEPGAYEGEVEITFSDGDKQTVYDLLKFTVRAQFA